MILTGTRFEAIPYLGEVEERHQTMSHGGRAPETTLDSRMALHKFLRLDKPRKPCMNSTYIEY